jgi:hypothetical protein
MGLRSLRENKDPSLRSMVDALKSTSFDEVADLFAGDA